MVLRFMSSDGNEGSFNFGLQGMRVCSSPDWWQEETITRLQNHRCESVLPIFDSYEYPSNKVARFQASVNGAKVKSE